LTAIDARCELDARKEATMAGDDEDDNASTEFTRHDLAQARVRVALARGDTYAEAARAGGVHERTVARWMAQPKFSLSVSDARREQLSVATGRLTDAAPEAVEVLLAAMRGNGDAVTTRAALAVLAWQTKLRRAGDMEDRLLKVEARDGHRPTAADAEEP
jgi:hypothetical protein